MLQVGGKSIGNRHHLGEGIRFGDLQHPGGSGDVPALQDVIENLYEGQLHDRILSGIHLLRPRKPVNSCANQPICPYTAIYLQERR